MQDYIKNFIAELKKVGRGIKNLRFFKFEHIYHAFAAMSRKEKIFTLSMVCLLLADLIFMGTSFYIRHTVVVPAYGGSYSEGMVGEPRFINPLLAQTQTDKNLTALVYAGLYKFDGNGKMVPDLADSELAISDDQHTYTAKLKPNLKWSDGQAITADDVVFTIQTLQNADFKSPLRKIWSNITVQKMDDLTVQFTNNTTASPFVTNLTIGILPKHIWQNITADNFENAKYNLEPVGAGPYFVKEIAKAANGNIHSMTLNSYSNYALGKPYIDEIDTQFYSSNDDLVIALHTKEVDAVGYVPFETQLSIDPKKTKLTTESFPLYQYQALFFNLSKSKILANSDVRHVLDQSINRQEFINNVFGGMATPAYSPILPGQIGYDPNTANQFSYNLDAANATLDKNGWVKGADGVRAKDNDHLEFTITTNDFVLNVKSAEELQRQWAKIGAKIDINVVPTAQLQQTDLRSRDFQSLLFAENTGYDPDPFVFWHSSQAADPGFNLAQYKNNNIDKLITDARTNFDPALRAADYQQFQDIFLADMPAIIMDQSVFEYNLRLNIQGMNIRSLATPEDRFYDVEHWYLNTRRAWEK